MDLDEIITPVDPDKLEKLLIETHYNKRKRFKLVRGFRNGFYLHYDGERNVKKTAPNLKLRIGSKLELWNKVMKEVELKRFAGPFEEVPFEHYVQSPIGLVPKDKGKKTRLIFHLSYPKTGNSVNAGIPKDKCSVKYNDFDMAVKRCLEEGIGCHVGKSDMASAFRNLPMHRSAWKYLIMKAEHPVTGKVYFFVDKCLPFGSSISCKHFQDFSDGVAHIVKVKTKKVPVNYLDDFLFAALMKMWCDWQMEKFLEVCEMIKFPVALEKTEWGTTLMTFLGLLLDTERQVVCIPLEKISRAVSMIKYVLGKENKKITVHELQKLCGFLNFLCRCIIPGRAFTMRLYGATKGKVLKPHHHIRVSEEMKLDLNIWLAFLEHPNAFCRPFLEFDEIMADEVMFYTDASRNFKLGCGGICSDSWYYQAWNEQVMSQLQPSIQFLELYAVTVGVVLWIERFRNQRIRIFCDNDSVVKMINKSSSKCQHCMVLIRIITLESMLHNVRLFAKHVGTKENGLADNLSRLRIRSFKKLAPTTIDESPSVIPDCLWPLDKVWKV